MTRTASAPTTISRYAPERRTDRTAAPVRPPATGDTPARALHLTRRGRVLLVAALAAVLFGSFALGRTASQAAPLSAPGPAVQVATVQPGDSLWAVAQRIAPDNDTRQVVAQIRRLNDLSGSELRVGQQLLLPVAA